MAGYVYRGNRPEPEFANGPPPAHIDPEVCGTVKGYWIHHRNGEEKCRECRAAQAAYLLAYKAKKKAALCTV